MRILDNLRDTFKLMNRPRRRGTLICPKCGSRQIHSTITGGGKGWIIPSTYKCELCGYEGSIVVELEEGMENASSA